MVDENSETFLREQGDQFMPRFNDQGLITAVAQEFDTGEILMLAHVNQQAFDRSIETGFAHFWSRSRKSLWMKGETSGNRLSIKKILVDCDQDAIVFVVELEGTGACHTGVKSCFYRRVEKQDGSVLLKHD